MIEKWRPVPKSTFQISNLGRFKNGTGHIMRPWLNKSIKNPLLCTTYTVKTGKQYHRFHVPLLMLDVWPEVEPRVYGRAWIVSITALTNQSQNIHRKPANTNIGATLGGRRNLLHHTGWDHDPWDKMRLWNLEPDFFSGAQYCPCL